MSADLAAPPVLSTPEDRIFEAAATLEAPSSLSDDDLREIYDVERTIAELLAGGWTRIALQFPDHMLVDAPKVSEILGRELDARRGEDEEKKKKPVKVSILADTSYSACCVDEIAAEHADAQVAVHYGRTCLSPTSRLPVIYVYTTHKLDHGAVLQEFRKEFGDTASKVVVMADLTYQSHVETVVKLLKDSGYPDIVATQATRNPAGVLPNRQIVGTELDAEQLKEYALFHIADPPQSLLLALSSRFASLHILSIPSSSSTASTLTIDNPTIQTAGLLRRRFAKVLSLASAGVVGILVNTLSVSDFLPSIDLLRAKIAAAGKKSYTIVVGKLNPAKLANFAEVEGWVVVGCWESGLVEDDASYWRPVVTPFEMEVALMDVQDRVWGDEWWGGIEKLKVDDEEKEKQTEANGGHPAQNGNGYDAEGGDDEIDEDESMPPEYDLRTGRLISHSRPMRLAVRSAAANGEEKQGGESSSAGTALISRAAGEIASINGVASPGAEYLRSQRTWQGLGTDFDQEASTLIEKGRSGIARGYTVGDEDKDKH
ncbi:diphthamide biosynthesis protein 2 [Cordyceps fumosorosea ARSEF 2679]|uniref:2-(3-amino-3-carboxypropyl)histidine synthase subunit 2 n=1 Tax=Cordyceps fumosorosea (strain ARSEF 2679) TaxID=1081104 RepID=A0A168E489_CORFA|nr:diphthamide biosynthesis protein 2 [Cordyceps fumosorosea ARSEF 2679]OAA73356.1 diphthamide biosynthesis protein 2 [Cordyceps fumosorosea ARSEF 2679]